MRRLLNSHNHNQRDRRPRFQLAIARTGYVPRNQRIE
jgi:hypothetical protein